MERSIKSENGWNEVAEAAEGWEAWEAVTRDGPAVFVVDTAAFDHGLVRGRWLGVADGQPMLHAELTELLGHQPEEGSWAVIDQIGLGAVMAPETMTVADLATVADDLQRSSG